MSTEHWADAAVRNYNTGRAAGRVEGFAIGVVITAAFAFLTGWVLQ